MECVMNRGSLRDRPDTLYLFEDHLLSSSEQNRWGLPDMAAELSHSLQGSRPYISGSHVCTSMP